MVSQATQQRRRKIREGIRALTFEPLMRGTLVERLRKCGKSSCACAKDPAARHGGKWLTVRIEGTPHALHIRPVDEERVRKAIAAYSKLWGMINELTECELADLRRQTRERRRDRARRRKEP